MGCAPLLLRLVSEPPMMHAVASEPPMHAGAADHFVSSVTTSPLTKLHACPLTKLHACPLTKLPASPLTKLPACPLTKLPACPLMEAGWPPPSSELSMASMRSYCFRHTSPLQRLGMSLCSHVCVDARWVDCL